MKLSTRCTDAPCMLQTLEGAGRVLRAFSVVLAALAVLTVEILPVQTVSATRNPKVLRVPAAPAPEIFGSTGSIQSTELCNTTSAHSTSSIEHWNTASTHNSTSSNLRVKYCEYSQNFGFNTVIVLSTFKYFRMFVLRIRLTLGVLYCSSCQYSAIFSLSVLLCCQYSQHELLSILRVCSAYEVHWEHLLKLPVSLRQMPNVISDMLSIYSMFMLYRHGED